MAQQAILEKKDKVKQEDEEFLARLEGSLEDAKAGRVRRVR